MTVSLYARRKQWPLDAVTVLDGIERVVELHGDLTREQRAQLLEMANRCPVHKTLTSEMNIRTRLA
jgi:putative redox protein